jgi:4-hydroxybenzoate polyprenyltransferase
MQEKSSIFDYVRMARVDHWIKNLFILPGVVVAALILKVMPCPALVLSLLVAFLSTSLAASANYVINEWLDARFDQFHPTKKHRPVVVAQIQFRWVMVEYVLLVVLSLALALLVNHPFAAAIGWLLLMGLVYNVEPVRTKDIPFLDVLSESVNNMIRLLLGWFVVAPDHLPPSSILFGYWMGGAFLMAAKRFAEYRMIGDHERAGSYRRSFKAYSEASLLISAVCYAMCSLFFVGIFLLKYKIELLLAVPLLIALFCKYLAIAYKEDSAAQKPEKLYREKGLMAWCAAFVAVLALSLVIKVPWLAVFIGIDLVPLSF